jgi:hypothetical protein
MDTTEAQNPYPYFGLQGRGRSYIIPPSLTMSLAPGVRLGAYEIVALLGAGGIGAVYRATDARLTRDDAELPTRTGRR